MQEHTGRLASGNTFRATPYLVEVTDATGAVLSTIDANDITGVSRAGTAVTLNRASGPVTLDCASLDDAGRLESILRSNAPSSPIVLEQKKGGLGKKLGIGCLGLIGLIVVIVIVASMAGGGDDDEEPTRTGIGAQTTAAPGTSNQTNDEDVHAPLEAGSTAEVEPVDDRVVKVTIVGITDDAETGNQFLVPAEGNKYWAVEVLIEATGSKSINSGQWKMRAADGFEYERTFVTGIGQPLDFIGELTPGGKKQGTVVFEIPEGATPQWVRYDPNPIVDGDIYFDAP